MHVRNSASQWGPESGLGPHVHRGPWDPRMHVRMHAGICMDAFAINAQPRPRPESQALQLISLDLDVDASTAVAIDIDR